jgi:uncharacterized protein YjiS (DUF1127 family)
MSGLSLRHFALAAPTRPVAVAQTVADWVETRRTRRALGQLDDHLLKDIGISRDAAQFEAARPFWKE